MMPRGVTFGEDNHGECGHRAVARLHLLHGFEGEVALAVDSRKQGGDRAFMKVIRLGGLVQFGPHPGADLVCDGAVKLRITRAPLVSSRRDRRVKAANEQAVHGFRWVGRGHAQHENLATPLARSLEDRGRSAVRRVHKFQSVIGGVLLGEIEDPVIRRFEPGHESRPSGEGDGRGRARKRGGLAFLYPSGEVRKFPGRDHGIDHVECRAVQGQDEHGPKRRSAGLGLAGINAI